MVAENMKCCTDGKDKKIVIYKKCLADKKAEQKECLQKMLETTSAKHMVQFNAFFVSVFGASPSNPKIVALKTHYKECIDEKVKKSVGEVRGMVELVGTKTQRALLLRIQVQSQVRLPRAPPQLRVEVLPSRSQSLRVLLLDI